MRKDSNEQSFEFIRDLFENESENNQGWNDPGNMVFSNAIEAIETQSSKRRGSLLFPIVTIVGILAMVTTAWFITNQPDSNQVSVHDTLATTNTTANKEVPTVIDQHVSEVVESDEILIAQSPAENSNQFIIKEKKAKAALVVTPTRNNLKSTTKPIQASNTTLSSPVQVQTGLPNDLNESRDLGLKNITREANSIANLENEINRYKNLTSIDKLASLPVSDYVNMTSLTAPVTLDQQVYVPSVNKVESTLPAASLVLAFRNNFTTIKAIDSPYNVTIDGQNQYSHGLGFNIEFRKPVTQRLSILASAGFDRISDQSTALSVLEYNETNEINNDQGTTYVDEVTIHSPMGAFTQEMRFDIESRSSDEINHTVWIDQTASLFNLSAGFSYNLVDTDAILWDASLSGGVSYISQIQGTFFSEYEIDDKKVGDKDWFDSNNFVKAPVFASTTLSTSFTYKLTDRLGVQIGGGYQLGLSDVNKNIKNQVNSRSRIWTTQVGIRRTF